MVLTQVQGVCFRHATVEQARSLGAVGWCRNTSRGTVEVTLLQPTCKHRYQCITE